MSFVDRLWRRLDESASGFAFLVILASVSVAVVSMLGLALYHFIESRVEAIP